MSQKKKQIRQQFRSAVFARDRYRCRVCGFQSTPEKAEEELDAHHITDRNEMPNGGYVKENGVSLCKEACHVEAELGSIDAVILYNLIGLSKEKAVKAAERRIT